MTVQKTSNYQVNPYYNQQTVPTNMHNQDLNKNLVDIKEHSDCFEYVYENPASTGKKVGVGVASAVFPGVGQMINGQWGKGFAFLGSALVAPILIALCASKSLMKYTDIESLLKSPELRKSQTATTIAVLALKAFSCFDAVKNAKKKETVIMPKQPANYSV